MRQVSILTHSFLDAYNGRIHKIFGGGLERYIFDLCEVIRSMGLAPEVHQFSHVDSFVTEFDGIKVTGYSYPVEQMVQAFGAMSSKAPGSLIYSSCIWNPISYRQGSLGICHGINWDQHDSPREQKAQVASSIQSALDQLSRIVTVDSHFLTFCRSVCSFTEHDKMILIPNAVDTAFYTPRQESREQANQIRILYPRRISYERGIFPMMLIANRLLAAYPQVFIEFAGEVIEDDPISDAFLYWLNEHPHKERIIHSVYSFEKMKDAYDNADIAVIPTIFSEGTSYACLEALSSGLPTVASNVGGLNDLIIDGFNGMLVSPTQKNIFSAISYLVEHPAVREQMGSSARQTAIAFDKSIWKKRWAAVLEEYVAAGFQ